MVSDKVTIETTVVGDKADSPTPVSDVDNPTNDLRPESANRKFSKRSFWSWFDPNDGPLERRLIVKLDFFILVFAFIGFWVGRVKRRYVYNVSVR